MIGVPARPVERRVATVLAVLAVLDLLYWLGFTARTAVALSDTLFWSGLLVIAVGLAMVCGAYRGMREPDVDLVLGPSAERSARRFEDVRRAYGDLNVLALAGSIAVIAALLVH